MHSLFLFHANQRSRHASGLFSLFLEPQPSRLHVSLSADCAKVPLPRLQAVSSTSSGHVPSCNPAGLLLALLTAAMIALIFPTRLLCAHQFTLRVSRLPSPFKMTLTKPAKSSIQRHHFPSKLAPQLDISVAAHQRQPAPSCLS